MAQIAFYSGFLGMICSGWLILAFVFKFPPALVSETLLVIMMGSGLVLDAFSIVSGIYFISIDKGERTDSIGGIMCGLFGFVLLGAIPLIALLTI